MVKNIIWGVLALLFFVGCHDENLPCQDPTNPLCPNFDSCLVFSTPMAAFEVYDSIRGISCYGADRQDLVFKTDTTLGNRVLLRATQKADDYTWTVGSDPKVYKGSELYYDFGLVSDSTDIPVRLIVCNTLPVGCQHIACDTFYKTVHVIPVDFQRTDWSYVIGRFKGAEFNRPDSFIVTINSGLPPLQGIINLPEGCTDQYLDIQVYRHGFLLNPGSAVCDFICGVGRIQEDRRTLVIEYTTKHEEPNYLLYVKHRWSGYRIE